MRRPLWSRGFGCVVNPTIVLLTGAYTNSACWPSAFVHRLVDRHFHVMTLDHRDFGKSDSWNGTAEFSMDEMALDVLHTMTARRIRAAHIFGASMGGSIALRMALMAPERCLTINLLATTPGRLIFDHELPKPSKRALDAMWTEMQLARTVGARTGLAVRTRVFGDDETMHSQIIRQGYNPWSAHGKACMSSTSLNDRLIEISTPALIVHGKDDEMYPVEHGWRLHHGLCQSKLLLLDDVNHRFPHEYSELIADSVATHVTTGTLCNNAPV